MNFYTKNMVRLDHKPGMNMKGDKAFKLGVLIREARKNAKLTQHDLAERTGTKRSYISRIENDASDIRLSTLLRIVEVGLGGKLEINFNL